MGRNFLHHLHTNKVAMRSLQPSATLGLGIACLTCFVILVISGVTLFLYYLPDQEFAYERILHITTTLRYGSFVRNLHYVSANALLVLSVLHLARIVLTGSYVKRWLNWLYGLILLALIMFANFTGYLLPWDQISYWAVKVGASLLEYVPQIGLLLKNLFLGGEDVGHETLLRSFAFHAGFVPLLMLVFTGLHLWRIRKDGGLAVSQAENNEKIDANPWLYRAESGVAFLTLAVMLLLSLYLDAPIYERANPLHPPNPAKAPWYFVGIQEMISYSAMVGGVVVPSVILTFLILLPKIDRSSALPGQWFSSERFVWWGLFLIIMITQIVFIVIGVWFRGPNWQIIMPF